MRKILVAGNWKMHGSTEMVSELIEGLLAGTALTLVLGPVLYATLYRLRAPEAETERR